ncbi:hypothetical protein [Aquibacillus salsiterrae]|uniref:Uncharacterized protein n=1 Tax=Aquibacillus salsiterrae TaxID=2950439 RepID=A0A9X4AFH7_9BACI|nr:hypothetical protein [Aquibacillus salsiterrae]MDC3416215.1 hypothetical protein [Aquibacillus salsiterrae]
MKMPFNIINNMSNKSESIFRENFLDENSQGYILDNLWFRTQDEKNKIYSNRNNDDDQRRRVFHSMQRYTIHKNKDVSNLVIDDFFIYVSISMPEQEIDEYEYKVTNLLNSAGWKRVSDYFEKGDLLFQIHRYKNNDLERYANFELNYSHIEIIVRPIVTEFNILEHNDRIWKLFNKGIRSKGESKKARTLQNMEEFMQLLPAQIETGCGPSLEIGISPLHDLHEIYKVQNKEGYFYFGETDTFFEELIMDEQKKFEDMSKLVRQFVQSTPSDNHIKLKELFELGIFKGEILSNNLDRIFSRTGLTESIIRKYDVDNFFPKVNFHPEVKSLLVIGSHADRRKVWEQARSHGLKVIHVNPEGYQEGSGVFFNKPIENINENDIHLKLTYSEFINLLYSHFQSKLELTKG